MSNEDESSTKLDVIHNPSTTPWFIAWCVCVTKPSMLILEQVWTYQPITITVKHSFLKSTIKRSKIRWKNIYFLKIITQVDLTWKLTFHHCIMLGNWSRFDNYSKNIYNQILLITQFLQMGMKKRVLFFNKMLEILHNWWQSSLHARKKQSCFSFFFPEQTKCSSWMKTDFTLKATRQWSVLVKSHLPGTWEERVITNHSMKMTPHITGIQKH